MADSAEVHSLHVLSDLRVALIAFGDDAKIALQDVDFEIRRTLEWLSNTQRLYWQSEIRRWQQKLAQAKNDLERKKLMKFGDHRPDTSQELKAVRRAASRLENAERTLEKVKRWIPELQHAVQEYRTQVQPLADAVDMQLPRHAARLERMIEALEQYARMTAPRTPDVSPGGRTSLTRESMARPDDEIEPVPSSETDADADADDPHLT